MRLPLTPSIAATLLAAPLLAQGIAALPDLHFGKEPWHLALTLPGLKPAQADKSNPDRQTFYYVNEDRSVIVSVIVENARTRATMASCRRVFEQRAKAPFIDHLEIKAGKRGEAALQEYTVNLSPDGSKVQRHIHTCRVRGNEHAVLLQRDGAKFDIESFHDHAIGHGQIPLPVFEAEMPNWVKPTA